MISPCSAPPPRLSCFHAELLWAPAGFLPSRGTAESPKPGDWRGRSARGGRRARAALCVDLQRPLPLCRSSSASGLASRLHPGRHRPGQPTRGTAAAHAVLKLLQPVWLSPGVARSEFAVHLQVAPRTFSFGPSFFLGKLRLPFSKRGHRPQSLARPQAPLSWRPDPAPRLSRRLAPSQPTLARRQADPDRPAIRPRLLPK